MADPNPFREAAYPTHATAPPPNPTNTAGLVGLILSLAGVLTCGVLFPVGLIVSLFGLRKAPRGLAIAGASVGLLGTVVCGAFVVFVMLSASKGIEAMEGAVESAATEISLRQAQIMIESERAANGKLPEGIEGNKLILEVNDAWENDVRYELNEDQYTIRSAGKDGQFNTADDMVVNSDGGVPEEEMLEADVITFEVEE